MKQHNKENIIKDEAGLQPLFFRAREVSLSVEEKAAGMSALLKAMAETPAAAGADMTNPVPTPYYSLFQRGWHLALDRRGFTMGALAALVLFAGAATSFAAQGSLPGDALYPIKIHVNEAFQLFLSPDIKARAKAEVAAAVRRLDEAKALADQGKLERNQSEIDARFEENARAALADAVALRANGDEQGADDVLSAFSLELASRSDISASVSASSTSDIRMALASLTPTLFAEKDARTAAAIAPTSTTIRAAKESVAMPARLTTGRVLGTTSIMVLPTEPITAASTSMIVSTSSSVAVPASQQKTPSISEPSVTPTQSTVPAAQIQSTTPVAVPAAVPITVPPLPAL